MASKLVASAPFLLSKFTRNLAHRPYGVAPLSTATRSFSMCSPSLNTSIRDNTDLHPFQRAGELGPCRVDKTKKDCYVMRVDVPGIHKEEMVLWVESGYIYFSAKDSEIPHYNYDGRVYRGSISFNPEKFDSNQVKSEVRDGVLWIVVPRLNK